MAFREERELADQALKLMHSGRPDTIREWPPAASRIQSARERLRLSVSEVAARLGMSSPNYRNIELHEDEVFTGVPLATILELAEILHSTIDDILWGGRDDSCITKVSFAEVVQRLEARRVRERLEQEQLDDIVGWYTQEYFGNPDLLWTLTILGIRDFCAAADVPWFDVLPHGK